MKRLLVAVVCALTLGGALMASCPFAIECPYDGFDTYYVGMFYSQAGKCLCRYRHSFGGKAHEVVMACE